jgi:hypothetical protein
MLEAQAFFFRHVSASLAAGEEDTPWKLEGGGRKLDQ